MASDSVRFEGDRLAGNDRSGIPNNESAPEGGFDATDKFESVFHRGAMSDSAERATVTPDPPGAQRLKSGERPAVHTTSSFVGALHGKEVLD